MLPFGLKIAWFVLSISGLLSCCIVLWAFGRAAGSRWGPSFYCAGNLLLQGMFCLGMIYRMDPFKMPRSFCIAQNVIIPLGGYMITGACMAFSLATSMAVLKPKTWGNAESALRWRNIYAVPTIAFPIIASIVHIVLALKLNAIHPSDDMHCDAASPEWVRFFGNAGLPFIVSWPSLYLSIKSILRVYKTNQHLQRARPESAMDDFASLPRKKRKSLREVSFTTRISRASVRRESITPAISGPASLSTRKFHLPFQMPSFISDNRNSNFSTQGDDHDDTSSRVSVLFPTFAHPSTGSTLAEEQTDRGIELPEVDGLVERKNSWQDDLDLVRVGDSVNEDGDWNEDKVELRSESDIVKDDSVMDESVPYSPSPRPTSMAMSATGISYRKPRRQPPSLAPTLWRIILFQFAFIFVQFLACISTFIDVVTKRPTPTPLGTHHFALLLAAWGPVIVFGHLPAVRRNLMPWRPAS